MGNVAKTLKITLLRMSQRDTQNAASIAADIAMKLAAADTDAEFFTARQSLGEVNTAFRSEYVMIASILTSGNITVATRKIARRVLIDD
jgi:carbon monoxide dehydrogenase subunit G